jgi:hypothetical protein
VRRVRIKYDGCDPDAPVLPIRLPVQLQNFPASDSNDSGDDGNQSVSTAQAGPARFSQISSERAAADATAAAAGGASVPAPTSSAVHADSATGTTAKAKPGTAAVVDTDVLSLSIPEHHTAQQAQLAAVPDSSGDSDTDETPPLSTHAGGSSAAASAAAAAAAVDTSRAVAAAAAATSSSDSNSGVQLNGEEYDQSVQAQLTQLRSSTTNTSILRETGLSMQMYS